MKNLKKGMFKDGQLEYLGECVEQGKNIVIVGSMGSGKTTLIKELIKQKVMDNKRIVILAEAPEYEHEGGRDVEEISENCFQYDHTNTTMSNNRCIIIVDNVDDSSIRRRIASGEDQFIMTKFELSENESFGNAEKFGNTIIVKMGDTVNRAISSIEVM